MTCEKCNDHAHEEETKPKKDKSEIQKGGPIKSNPH